jgi:undecaprenyl-diphosphatase
VEIVYAGADVSIAESANRFAAHHDGWEDAARAYASVSELLFVVGLALLLTAGVVLARRRLTSAGLLALVATGGSLLVAHFVSVAVDRPRPFVSHPSIHSFLSHAADASFPSDHATAAFAIAGVLVIRLGMRAVPVLVAALALAVSRVVVGVHYPSDVLAGALIGLAAAAIVCALAPRVARVVRTHGDAVPGSSRLLAALSLEGPPRTPPPAGSRPPR